MIANPTDPATVSVYCEVHVNDEATGRQLAGDAASRLYNRLHGEDPPGDSLRTHVRPGMLDTKGIESFEL